MLRKTGINLQIIRVGSLDTVAQGKTVKANPPVSKKSEFVYFAAKAIAADDPNGNGDFFPWPQLLESYSSFNGRSLFLNHNSDDPLNAIGKVLDAYPVEDPKTGEKYIECLAKVDAVAHPELARQLSTGILDAVSMGCSVEESMCSVCGHIVHSDEDDKCQHMSKGLLKDYIAEIDLPDFGIKKGQKTQAFAINKGINFTELSVVNVPAWNNAKIVQVISNLTDEIKKKANTKQEGGPSVSVLIRTLEDLTTMAKKANAEAPTEPKKEAEESTEDKVETKAEEKTEEKIETKAEESTEEKVEATAEESTETKIETSVPATEISLKELLGKKLSALEYIELQTHFEEKTKEVEAAPEAEVAPEATVEAKEETDKVETEAKKDDKKDEKKESAKAALPGMSSLTKWMELLSKKKVSEKVANKFETVWKKAAEDGLADAEAAKAAIESLPEEFFKAIPETTETVANYKAIFVSKPSIKESYWIVTNNGQPILKATLDQAWGNKLSEVVDYATSTEYGDTLLRRLKADGVEKVASLISATVYEKEASDQRGQIGPGTAWPGQKGIGKSQYKPSQYGGAATPASKGPSAGSGDQAASSKSVGKSQYKPGGYGGKATPASAGPSAQKGKVKGSEVEKVTKKAYPDPEMAEAPAAEMPAEMPAEAPAEEMDPCQMADDAARLEHMEKMLSEMEDKELAKPVETVRKAVEKLEEAKAKADEKKAKEDEKEAAKAAKEQEKIDKETEKERAKAEKESEKERAAAEKESKDEAPAVETESTPEETVTPESKENPEEKVEAKTEEKIETEAKPEEKVETEAKTETDEKKEVEAKPETEDKKEVEAKEETDKVETEAKKDDEKDEKKESKKDDEKDEKKESSESTEDKVETTADESTEEEVTVEASPSEREVALERELAQVKAEQFLKEKTVRARAIADEMLDKGLITHDEREVQAAVADGERLFDARSNALKTAIDRQITDLLKMDSNTLKAFASSIRRVKKTASQSPNALRNINLKYSEHTGENKWLDDVFGQMGSQKKKI